MEYNKSKILEFYNLKELNPEVYDEEDDFGPDGGNVYERQQERKKPNLLAEEKQAEKAEHNSQDLAPEEVAEEEVPKTNVVLLEEDPLGILLFK
jgi:hypothetical protein